VTSTPYSYAADDPVNGEDISGLWTEGLCIHLNLGGSASAVITGGAGGSVCLVEANGNKQVGVVFTGGAGFSLSINGTKWKNILTNPSAEDVGSVFGLSGGVTLTYEISNAQSVTDLKGRFHENTATLGEQLGIGGAYFTGCSRNGPVTGMSLGFGLVYGASLGSLTTWSKVVLEKGLAAQAIIATINTFTQNPANLLLRSTLRGLISAVT